MASETMKTIKKVDKKNKTPDKKPNPFVRFGRYVKEVYFELKRVSWPNRKELISATWQVMLFVVMVGAIVYVLDLGLVALFQQIMKIGA